MNIEKKELEELVTNIEEHLGGDYKVLEGAEDTIYLKNRKTDNHYEIKISPCE